MADGHLFNNIHLRSRGGTNPGQFRVHSEGIAWKTQGGGKVVEVDKADIVGITWKKVSRSHQLRVTIKDGLVYKFTGFRNQDASSLTFFVENKFGKTLEEGQLSISGHNSGVVDSSGNMLPFLVGSKEACEVSLADASHTRVQGQNEVMLDLDLDDITGANEKDSLMDTSFHIPNSNTEYVVDESRPPVQVFHDKIMPMADARPSREGAVVAFDDFCILTPRAKCRVELHLSYFRLRGKAMDVKIQYKSVIRLFLLPKSNEPHAFVVVTLDPAILIGKTLYPHIVLQFKTDDISECTLSMYQELLNMYKDKLQYSYKGPIHEVFTMILRGLSCAKVTRHGKFRSRQNAYAVNTSLKTEGGALYPLEMGFFFLPKSPTLILFDEIGYIEFERFGAPGTTCFDLVIRLKDKEHVFQNILNSECDNLSNFIRGKSLRIKLGGAEDGEEDGLKKKGPKKKQDSNAIKEVDIRVVSFDADEGYRERIMSVVEDWPSDFIVAFYGILSLRPRERYDIELHLSSFLLKGQQGNHRIQYNSILGLFLLPTSNQSQTLVVISVDQNEDASFFHPYIVLEFETDAILEYTSSLDGELLSNKYKLGHSYKGHPPEIFTNILRVLTGVNVTGEGKFRSRLNGYALNSSLERENGVLYPLDEGFFFLPEPPTLILNDEIFEVEFKRRGVAVMDMCYFDLVIRLINDQKHVFRNIWRKEYDNLFTFVRNKELKIRHIKGVEGPRVTAVLQKDIDPQFEHLQNIIGDSSEEKHLKKRCRREAFSSKASPPKKKSKEGDEDSLEEETEEK